MVSGSGVAFSSGAGVSTAMGSFATATGLAGLAAAGAGFFGTIAAFVTTGFICYFGATTTFFGASFFTD